MSVKRISVLLCSLFWITGLLSARGAQSGNAAGGDSGKPMVITSVAYQMAPIAENPKMINYYNKMFNIDLQIWNVDNGRYDEQLNLKFAANEIPDIFRSTLPNLQKYYDQQIMAEIPESMMKEKMPLVYNSSKAAAPDFLERGKVNNKIYMLPSQISVPIRGPAVYRGDWIKAVGKQDAPKTLAELEALLYLFANNDPDKNGKKDTYGLSNSGFNMVYGAFGYIPGQWQERNGSLVYSSIQPEIKEALTVLAKWYKDGVIDPEFITGENKGGYWALSHAFIEERIGFSGLGSYYHWHFTPAASQNYRELKAVNATAADSLIFGEPVTGPRGAKGLAMGAPIGSTSEAFGVQVEKDPLKMGKIMELWNHFFESNDAYLTGWMGILGEDWDYNENKAPIPRAHADINWLAGNGAHTVTAVIYRPDDVTVRTPYFAPILENWHYFENGYYTKLGKALPSSGTYQTELSKIEDEAFISIITGERPVSYFDTFVAQWKSQGGDVLTREANR